METDFAEAKEQRSVVAPALTGGFPPDGFVLAQFPPYLLSESSAPRQDLGAHEKVASCLQEPIGRAEPLALNSGFFSVVDVLDL